MELIISMSSLSNYLVAIHMAVEAYALWATNGSPPFNNQALATSVTSVCPLSGSKNIYPGGRPSPPAIISLLLLIFGGLFRISSHRELGKMFTWDTAIFKDHKLITTGPYRFVRHPAYTGFIMVSVSYTCFLCAPGTFMRECLIGHSLTPSAFTIKSAFGICNLLWWALLDIDSAIFLMRRSYAEDNMLKREFGKEWDEWAKKVRWNVFPYLI